MRTKKITIDDGHLVFHRVNYHGYLEELQFKDWVLDLLTDITGDCRFDTLVNKRFSLRFRIANFIMQDELSSALGGIMYYARTIADYIPEGDCNKKGVEYYTKRILRYINKIM